LFAAKQYLGISLPWFKDVINVGFQFKKVLWAINGDYVGLGKEISLLILFHDMCGIFSCIWNHTL